MYQKLSPVHSPPAMEFVLSTEGGNPTESHLEGLLSRITLSTICHSPGFQKTACVRAHLLSLTLVTPRTVARQASLSMGFPRQKYWSGLPFPFQGLFPAGINYICYEECTITRQRSQPFCWNENERTTYKFPYSPNHLLFHKS